MKPFELFGVVIRTIGLFFLMAAITQSFMALLTSLIGGRGIAFTAMIYIVPSLLIALWCLLGAPPIVSIAYGSDGQDQSLDHSLERDAMEAMTLLKAGKIEQAKAIANKKNFSS
ncbi:MAG: hypothetical protein COA78_17025 [Blastopirellula sp.]|nr:MAG: hypothetical protein COA78_17025 [Blastopirellula sp.]